MKRKNILLITLVLMTFGLCISFVSATTDEGTPAFDNISFSNPFKWATSSPPNYIEGLILGLLGGVGAVVAIYFSIGFALPGTAGMAIVEEEMIRLRKNEDLLDGMMSDPNCNPECLTAKQTVVENHRKYITGERWKQYLTGFPLYIILGGFFALMLATDLLQALLMGFGWTTIVGSLGLKSDFQYRKDKKNLQLDASNNQISGWKELIESILSRLERTANYDEVKEVIIKIRNDLNKELPEEILTDTESRQRIGSGRSDGDSIESLSKQIDNMKLNSRKTMQKNEQVKRL
ncbi:MAG: hypothetical protein CVV33_01095 [Methanomicrobiales archaeon HGW-Methanomicrobiales-4]|nr:MAG: hypothetical protein CVV33_01095 [Methanomicrobiales archaeon HGW-Methanomicrobiales-4]